MHGQARRSGDPADPQWLRPNGRLFVAKVGEVQVGWSPPLPAAPSSVTITLDGAGRDHASFVVEIPAEPLATVETVGVDLGLACFAALSTGEQVDNPRWLVAEKAERHGRTLVKVDPWYPSSQRCSTCGVTDGPKPRKVRAWACAACRAAHDRDLNAAGDSLAAGRAVTACGPGGGPPARAAVGDEAGTTRDAAA